MAVSADAGLVQGFVEGLPQRDAEVFHCVMCIDLQIAFSHDVHVDQTVARNLLQHVLKKGQAGFDREFSSAIEIHTHLDTCFFGIAFNAGLAC